MKKNAWLLLWLCLGGSAWAEETNNLPVRVVGLFTSGVGYFQHAGTVSGEGRVTLSFRDSQINDLLKSLVVEDLSGNLPDPVIYPSRDPQERLLERFHVNLSGNPSLADILRQLRGTQVRLQIEGRLLTGTLLGVEQRPLALGKKAMPDWVINLATNKGLRVVPIKDMGLLELTNAELRDDLKKALEILDQGRGQNRKSLSLRFPGQGIRQVRVGYVVETPLWKTSYRLIFPKEGETARLQGWAIIENQSSNDWKGVRLFLVSGQPLSFTQNLYQPHYITRPKVETEAHLSIAPPRYKTGLQEMQVASKGSHRRVRHRGMPAPQAPSMGSGAYVSEDDGAMSMGESQQESWTTQALQPSGTAVTATKVGALFQFVVDEVDLPQRRGAMIPIIADTVVVEKVSIYNQKTLANYPLEGVLLKNTTGKHLPAGPVTLFNGGFYGGDARMEDLPAGQERLLSYAVDQEVQVLSQTKQTETLMTSGKITGAVFILSRKHLAHYEYRLENRGKEVKTLIVEHPVRPGWTLVNTTERMESTTDWHRFRRGIPSGKQTTLTVTEEQIQEQRLSLLHNNSSGLFAQIQGKAFSPALRQALGQAATLHQAVETIQRDLDENSQRLETFKKEQERVHANLSAVSSGTDFHNKMIRKLDELETAIEEAQVKEENLRAEQLKRRDQLEAYLRDLNVA